MVRCLHEMLSIDDKEILKLIPDYRINLIDPMKLTIQKVYVGL